MGQADAMRCKCCGGVALSVLLLVQQAVVADPRDDVVIGREPAENGTGDEGGIPLDGRDGLSGGEDRGTRRAEPQRGQRCSEQPLAAVGDDDDGGSGGGGGTLLEATRTVDRYRVKPVVQAYYEGPPRPFVYRQRPAVAMAYVRRRRPVTVMQDRPQVLLLQPRPKDVWIGPPLPYVPVPDKDHRPAIGEPLVSLTTDQVRRVLQQMFSEGVMAGEAVAATGTKFVKV